MHSPKKDPGIILAIIIAARKTGDRTLERTAKSMLNDEYGIRITLPPRKKPPEREVANV